MTYLQKIQKWLAETNNCPDLEMCCWSFTWCGQCNQFAGQCCCANQPWNWPLKEQSIWLKRTDDKSRKISKAG